MVQVIIFRPFMYISLACPLPAAFRVLLSISLCLVSLDTALQALLSLLIMKL